MKKVKVNPRSVRFSDASWYHPGIDVIVGGAGGIGSWLCFFLGRQECNIFLYDDDIIDETNLGGQLYNSSDIGKNKASATAEHVFGFTEITLDVMGKYTKEDMSGPVAFACFDNMEARKLMFDNWCEVSNKQIFIDGRMLAENFQVIAVLPKDI